MIPLHRIPGGLAAALIVLSGCGGGTSTPTPVAPTPVPVQPAPAPPSERWSIAGTVVDTVTRTPIAGATIVPSWELASVLSGPAGEYALGAVANPPDRPYKLTISAPGYLTRDQWITWKEGRRDGITLDLIRNTAPFSLDFYRQLVRGAYDHEEAPYTVLRWMQAPRFYLQTVDQNGKPVEPEVVQVIRDGVARAVPAYTGGQFSAVIETGTEARPDTDGWITIVVQSNAEEDTVCGRAFVGSNPGHITLNKDVCSCGSVKVPGSVVMHEVGHALGFFHVSDLRSVMYPTVPGSCPAGDPTPLERYHAAIAYSRPRGNTDPDNDPSSRPSIGPGARGPVVVIAD